MDESSSSGNKYRHTASSKTTNGTGHEIESNADINVSPFKLQWAIGMNAHVPIINLTTKNRNLIVYAASHMVIVYDYVSKDMMSLQGHQNSVNSLSASRDSKWLLSADYERDNVCIVWDTETRVPVCSLFNSHGSNFLAAAKLSPDGKYIVTVGDEYFQVVKFWLWTRGRDEPDGTIELRETSEDRVKEISFNDDFPDQFLLTLVHSVLFVSWRDGTLSLDRPRVQTKNERIVGKFNDSCYVANSHLAMSVTSNGFVLVWSDAVVDNNRRENRKRSTNRKMRLVKSVPLQRNKSLTRIENGDNIIVIGNDCGQLHLYDYQLKLLYWCENCGLDAIISMSFDRASDLMSRPRRIQEIEFSIDDDDDDDSEELDDIVDTEDRDDDEVSKQTPDQDDRKSTQEEEDENGPEEADEADVEIRNELHIARTRDISLEDAGNPTASNITINIDYSANVQGMADEPTDCGLKPAEFRPPKMFVSSASGKIARLDIGGLKCRFILQPAEGSVTALATRSKSEYMVTGNSLGTLCLYKYTSRSLMVAKKTPTLPNFFTILDDGQGGRDITHVTCPQTHQSLVGVSALRCSPGSGEFLACGLQSGVIWILHPDTLEPVDPTPYKHSSSTILDLIFSDCGEYLAYSDDALTVGAFKRNNNTLQRRTHLWNFLGKYHSHYMPVRQILFARPTAGKNVPRLFSLGEDQNLVEYDLESSGPYPEPGLKILHIERIEKDSAPLCMAIYPQFGVESFLILANSKHKFRLINDSTKTIRATFLGPTFGDPVQKILTAGRQTKRKNHEYIIFATSKEIGLMILPFDGNPYKIVAMIGHAKKIGNMAISDCGRYLFTIGKNDRSVLVWSINYRAVETIVHLGGSEELTPFYRLIEDGKDGWLVNEMKDLFYYAQILQQGENTTAPRIVTDKVSIMQLPNLMRAIGFYPTNGQLENMMEEVSYKHYADTGELVDEITFEEFVKLYVNHRPASGITRNEIKESFKCFANPADPDDPCLSSQQFLEILFGRGGSSNDKLHGEPFTVEEAHAYLGRLMPQQDEDSTSYTASRGDGDEKVSKTEFNFEFLPPNISFKDFTEEILGIEHHQSHVSKAT